MSLFSVSPLTGRSTLRAGPHRARSAMRCQDPSMMSYVFVSDRFELGCPPPTEPEWDAANHAKRAVDQLPPKRNLAQSAKDESVWYHECTGEKAKRKEP